MCALHYPPTRSAASLAFKRAPFLPACPDVGREAKRHQRGPSLRVVVSLIQAHTLGPRGGRLGPLDDEAVEGRREQLHIRPIGAGDDEPQRPPLALGQQAALDATFAVLRGIGARFFPRPRALWSGPRPYLTTASLCLSAPRTAPRRLARVS